MANPNGGVMDGDFNGGAVVGPPSLLDTHLKVLHSWRHPGMKISDDSG